MAAAKILTKKQLVRRVVALVPVAVAEGVEEGF